MSRKKKHTEKNIGKIPNRTGAYELIYGKKTVYVGVAEDLQRVMKAMRRQQKFDAFVIHVTDTFEEATRLRDELVASKSPKRNRYRDEERE